MPAASPPIDVFVSYAAVDRDRVRLLVAALENLGRRVWWDREILPGRTWDEVIEAALDKARCVVVVWSRAAVSSQWVRLEAAVAKERRKLIPLQLDPVTVPLAFRDLQTANLMEWSGDESDPSFRLLAQAIEAFLRPDEQLAPPPPTTLEERVLDAAMPSFVQVRNSVELIGMVRCASSDGLKAILEIEPHPSITADDVVSRPFAIEFPRDSAGNARSVALTLRVEAPDFEPPFQQKRISVRPQTDSQICCFLLRPRRAGELLVNFEVRSDDETLAARLIRTNGVDDPETPSGMVLVTLPIAITSTPAQIASFTALSYGLQPLSQPGEFTRMFESPVLPPPPVQPPSAQPPASQPPVAGEYTQIFGRGPAPAQPQAHEPAGATGAFKTPSLPPPPETPAPAPRQPASPSYAAPAPRTAPAKAFSRLFLVVIAIIALLILIAVIVSVAARG